jgi:hypothetical protein
MPRGGPSRSSSHGQPSGPSHTSAGPDVGTSPSGGHFGVEPDKLDSMAGKLGQTSEKLGGLSSSFDRLDFGARSFGVVGQGFAGPARQHVRHAKQLTDKVGESVSQASAGTKTVAQKYRDTDADAAKMLTDSGSGHGSGGGGTVHAPPPVSTSHTGGFGPSSGFGQTGGIAGSSGGGRPPRKPGGNQPVKGHYDDKPDTNRKRKRAADDAGPPPRKSGRLAGDGPEVPFDDRAGMPPRPGGGGFVFGDGNSHHATLSGPNGPVTVHGPQPTHGPTGHNGSENVNYGQVNVHHQGVEQQQFHPQPPPPGVQPPNFSPAHPGQPSSSYVSQDVMGQFAGRRDEFPTQNQVMGGSANHAMQSAGMHVDPNTQRDWTHGHGFASGGEDHLNPNQPNNLTTGEHGANMRHNQFENAVRNQGTNMMGVVPTTAAPTNPVDPAHNVYGGLDYTRHSPFDPNLAHTAHTAHIDTTDPQMPRHADQHYVGRQEEVNNAWAVTGMLDDQGYDVNQLHPGMGQQLNNWNRQHYNPDMYDDPDAPPPSP